MTVSVKTSSSRTPIKYDGGMTRSSFHHSSRSLFRRPSTLKYQMLTEPSQSSEPLLSPTLSSTATTAAWQGLQTTPTMATHGDEEDGRDDEEQRHEPTVKSKNAAPSTRCDERESPEGLLVSCKKWWLSTCGRRSGARAQSLFIRYEHLYSGTALNKHPKFEKHGSVSVPRFPAGLSGDPLVREFQEVWLADEIEQELQKAAAKSLLSPASKLEVTPSTFFMLGGKKGMKNSIIIPSSAAGDRHIMKKKRHTLGAGKKPLDKSLGDMKMEHIPNPKNRWFRTSWSAIHRTDLIGIKPQRRRYR